MELQLNIKNRNYFGKNGSFHYFGELILKIVYKQ